MKNIITNKRGEAHVGTAIKIIIAVVIGALLLGGLFVVFASDDGILNTASNEVAGLMDYTQELRYERYYDEANDKYTIRYSYDGRHWETPTMPDYGDTATVYGVMSNNSADNPIEVALIQNGSTYYILASTDEGITWSEKCTFTATSISHFYYGTSSRLPVESGSFSGERFVIRRCSGGSTYYTMVSEGLTWSTGGWSDLIRPN